MSEIVYVSAFAMLINSYAKRRGIKWSHWLHGSIACDNRNMVMSQRAISS